MNPIKHMAIIMDGNGRWGLKHKNSRNLGHKEGLKTVEMVMKYCIKKKDPLTQILLKNLLQIYQDL